MLSEMVLSVILHDTHSSLLFCLGLMSSVMFCLMVLPRGPRVNRRVHQPVGEFTTTSRYQQFRHELISRPRHVGFPLGNILNLGDDEFHTDQDE
jgi:hypothetical protein